MQNRREFLKILAASGIGSAFFSHIASAHPYAAPGNTGLPNNLTVAAIMNDVATLAVRNQVVDMKLLTAIYSDYHITAAGNMSRFGWMVNAPESDVAQVLHNEKERADHLFNSMSKADRDNPDSEPMQQFFNANCKVSLMLGWFMAEGIRNILSPLWADAGDDYTDMAIYQDMYVLSKVAAKSAVQADGVASLMNEMLPRMLTRTHTLTPDYDDGQNWTVRISEWRPKTAALVEKCAVAYAQPDPAKLQAFVTEPDFYDEQDEIIAAARAQARIDRSAMNSKCLYGQAVLEGIEAVERGSAYLYPTQVKSSAAMPNRVRLLGNYPNPFNPSTAVRFELEEPAAVRLVVTNVRGQLVHESEPQMLAAGKQHEIHIDASDWSSGVYFYQVQAKANNSESVDSGQMTLLK